MTVDEIVNEQKRYLADFRRRTNGSKEERKQAAKESRDRLIASGILTEDGRPAAPYSSLF